jgi:hypothetical protein
MLHRLDVLRECLREFTAPRHFEPHEFWRRLQEAIADNRLVVADEASEPTVHAPHEPA